jgi:hypothetical protein
MYYISATGCQLVDENPANSGWHIMFFDWSAQRLLIE